MLNYQRLLYWITERDEVRKKKEIGMTKPWSNDMVFRTTYFCNVRREDDKVTQFIRSEYTPMVHHSLFEPNMILARFLNWPDSLSALGYLEHWDPRYVKETLNRIKKSGWKVWGNAYVVTTHGIKMDKIDYLCDRVMPSVLNWHRAKVAWKDCASTANSLRNIEGISTFMAGQVIADLKNTPGHRLKNAPDWWTFAFPGPGSIRGMDWLHGDKVPASQWLQNLHSLQDALKCDGWHLCAQDVQNCLCEYDKWERVTNGTGRSKRGYPGV